MGTVGVVLSVAAISLMIIAAAKSSCPIISAYDGSGFTLQGEIFGGAVYPQLSRYDYLPLKMKPLEDGSLQLKITNELKERQFTDYVRLWKVSHPKQSKIFVDDKGNLFSSSDPRLPEQALLNGNRDVSEALARPDDHHVLYPDDSSCSDARNEIILRLKKPGDATSGRLILVRRNSYFLDLLYGELAKGFGTLYPVYAKKQKKRFSKLLRKENSISRENKF